MTRLAKDVPSRMDDVDIDSCMQVCCSGTGDDVRNAEQERIWRSTTVSSRVGVEMTRRRTSLPCATCATARFTIDPTFAGTRKRRPARRNWLTGWCFDAN